eukprot:gene16089-7441_t
MTGYLSKFFPRYESLTKPLRDLTLKETQFNWNEEEDEAFQELKDSISSQDVIAFFNPKLPIMVRTVTMKDYQQDYSRRPRRDDDKDTEHTVKAIINDRPAVLLSKIKEETRKDETHLKLRTIITKGDWENHRRDADTAPFYSIKNEKHIAEDLIFRIGQDRATKATMKGD